MPLSTDGLSGERADDGVYIPSIERIRVGWQTPGLLFVGDGQMRALDTRASLARHQDWSVSPLPLTGTTAAAMDAWITVGVTKGEAGEFTRIGRTNDRGHEVRAAEGYACERTCHASDGVGAWRARVLVVHSPMHATQQAAG
jgi:transposase